MSQGAVQEILDRIKSLSDQERDILESRWARLVEEEWQSEVEKARVRARKQGLDQDRIDQVIHQLRYGS
jgi:hypothetical protein